MRMLLLPRLSEVFAEPDRFAVRRMLKLSSSVRVCGGANRNMKIVATGMRMEKTRYIRFE